MSKKGLNTEVIEPYSFALTKAICFDFTKSNTSAFIIFTNIVQDVLDFLVIWKTSNNFRAYLVAPFYDCQSKKEFIKEHFGTVFHPIITDFFDLVCDTNRIICIEAILNRFINIISTVTNNYSVEIQMANNIFVRKAQIDRKLMFDLIQNWLERSLSNTVNELYAKSYFSSLKVKFALKEIPDLLGGFRLNFSNQSVVIDLTIINKIAQIYKMT
uniref:ATP synthase CF1 delta subunit n=1 Tax=Haramonas pauciplastida TaxID=478668 RepID=UPI0021150683|nr:ATP synthase CF1 delta subunit [Haramonas pauciplastida]UTE94997.1 ATP synthase CF1 delta subunit [Haramonas pauciplastida]